MITKIIIAKFIALGNDKIYTVCLKNGYNKNRNYMALDKILVLFFDKRFI